jgi:hypothetical protein
MKALLIADNTLPLPVQALCDLVNATCQTISLTAGTTPVRIDSSEIHAKELLPKLERGVRQEAADYTYVFIATAVPYDNNYFFESSHRVFLFSFSGWNLLTSLPVTNGLLYFIASLLCDRSGEVHQETTGCVNDFWWDKRGVDIGMRAAFICEDCRRRFSGDSSLLVDGERLLDLVSNASRSGRDVLHVNISPARTDAAVFDVFLCHNSEDKAEIRRINSDLKAAGVRTWFDEEQLRPGQIWQAELERQIDQVRAACVFVGPNRRGPWQELEIRAFLSAFVNRACPVIPVLLEGATGAPDLPIFLREMMWVDLRENYSTNIARLIGALLARGGR